LDGRELEMCNCREKNMRNMRSVVNLLKQLKSDEDGASLIEYTVLLAILLVAVIAIIVAVGGWILNQWSNLNANLPT
jgi:pilus assembly protein Flp/PilA